MYVLFYAYLTSIRIMSQCAEHAEPRFWCHHAAHFFDTLIGTDHVHVDISESLTYITIERRRSVA